MIVRRAIVVFLLTIQPLCAQTVTGSDVTTVTPFLTNVSRLESWSFFDPPAGQGDPTYTFLSNRARLGVRVTSRKLDVEGAFQYAQIVRLPQRSIGLAGPLGTGALYFNAARAPEAYQLYFKTLYARVKNIVPGVSVAAGRMGYTSGAERRGDVAVEQIKQLRLNSRLIGEFEWSVFQRAFDGVRVDVDRRRWRATSALLFPTQGGFEESANPVMPELRLGTAALTVTPGLILPRSELQIFAYHYRDRRPVRGRPDNVGVVACAADVDLWTFGASHVSVSSGPAGELDSLIWVAGQAGDWYGQPHRAVSVAIEGGYKWKAPWSPWLRAGWLQASGDDDGGDNRHGTFFQMLPTSRRYAQSATYAQMNLRDLFAQLLFKPHTRASARVDVHRLTLANAADRWYSGSGATARTGNDFGFAARLSRGFSSLGTVIEGSTDLRISPRWSVNGYVGTILGGGVVRATFAGDHLRFFYLENVLAF